MMASASVSEESTNVVCCSCKKSVLFINTVVAAKGRMSTKTGEAVPDSRRCKPCNSQKARLERLFQSRQDLKDAWTEEIAPNQKKQFLEDNGNSVGAELEKNLEDIVTKIKRRVKSDAFVGTGTYKHKVDIEAKYKDKPDMLKYILEKGSTVQAVGTTLYEDLEFTSTTKNESQDIDERKTSLATFEKIKRPKVKREPKPKEAKGEADEPPKKKLKKKQINKFAKLALTCMDAIAQMDLTIEDSRKDTVAGNFPAAMAEKHAAMKALVGSDVSALELVVESGEPVEEFAITVERVEGSIANALKAQAVFKSQVDYFLEG